MDRLYFLFSEIIALFKHQKFKIEVQFAIITQEATILS